MVNKEEPEIQPNGCIICGKEHYAKSLCRYHYMRSREDLKKRKCRLCDSGHYAHGWCYKHYHQKYRRKHGLTHRTTKLKGVTK